MKKINLRLGVSHVLHSVGIKGMRQYRYRKIPLLAAIFVVCDILRYQGANEEN